MDKEETKETAQNGHLDGVKTIDDLIKEGNWKKTEEETPDFDEPIECSENLIDIDDSMVYMEYRVCMLAGYAGGHGYFDEGFATAGCDVCDRGLICDEPKYWRYTD